MARREGYRTPNLQHLGVAVNHGGNDVLPVQSQESLMQLVLRARCQNIEVSQFHPSVGRKQFMAQAKFRVLDLPGIFQSYWIFSLKLFDIHSIYTVNVMHIQQNYLRYT